MTDTPKEYERHLADAVYATRGEMRDAYVENLEAEVSALRDFSEWGRERGWFLNQARDGAWAVVVLVERSSLGLPTPPRMAFNCLSARPTLVAAINEAVAAERKRVVPQRWDADA